MRNLMSSVTIEKYRYDTEDERAEHVAEMEADGWVCTGQVLNSDIFGGEMYHYGEFYRYD